MVYLNERIVIVDGSYYFYRAYFAVPYLCNSKGLPTGAIRGMVNTIKAIQKRYPSKLMCVVFDPPGLLEKTKKYPYYKANRSSQPTDITYQFKPLIRLIRAMGINVTILKGHEGDDLIGTISRCFTEVGTKVTICSGDKDLLQLVSDDILVVNHADNEVFDTKTVHDRFGVYPSQVADYLAIVGDEIDNIPGVFGIGPKTAVKWLSLYDSVEKVLTHKDELEGAAGEKLRSSIDRLKENIELTTINRYLFSSINYDLFLVRPPMSDLINLMLDELEFKKL